MATFRENMVFQTILVWKKSTGFHLLLKQKKNLFSKATYPYSKFGIKIPLCWFNLAAYTVKCLSILSSFIVKKFKDNTIIYIIWTLCEFSIFAWLIFFTSFNLWLSVLCLFKDFTLFLKALTLFYGSLYSFSFLFQAYIHLPNTMIHLHLSLLSICNYFLTRNAS